MDRDYATTDHQTFPGPTPETVCFKLRDKTITINRTLYNELRERLFEFDEEDCKAFIEPILTEGSWEKGYIYPDLDKTIAEHSESDLSEIIEKGARRYRRDLA